jgi:hypothetical protein
MVHLIREVISAFIRSISVVIKIPTRRAIVDSVLSAIPAELIVEIQIRIVDSIFPSKQIPQKSIADWELCIFEILIFEKKIRPT